MKILNLAISVFIFFLSSLVYAENGYVDLKYLSERYSAEGPSTNSSHKNVWFWDSILQQNMKESDTEK
jgi:hypothetical protein